MGNRLVLSGSMLLIPTWHNRGSIALSHKHLSMHSNLEIYSLADAAKKTLCFSLLSTDSYPAGKEVTKSSTSPVVQATREVYVYAWQEWPEWSQTFFCGVANLLIPDKHLLLCQLHDKQWTRQCSQTSLTPPMWLSVVLQSPMQMCLLAVLWVAKCSLYVSCCGWAIREQLCRLTSMVSRLLLFLFLPLMFLVILTKGKCNASYSKPHGWAQDCFDWLFTVGYQHLGVTERCGGIPLWFIPVPPLAKGFLATGRFQLQGQMPWDGLCTLILDGCLYERKSFLDPWTNCSQKYFLKVCDSLSGIRGP